MSKDNNELIKYPPVEVSKKETSLSNWQALARCSTSEARSELPFSIAKRLKVLPLAIHRSEIGAKFLSVVFPEPLDIETIKEIEFAVGYEVVPDTAPRELVERAIEVAYLGGAEKLLEATCEAERYIGESFKEEISLNEVDERPIPQLLDAILHRALLQNASDIHLEPKGATFRIRFRIDGRLQTTSGFALTKSAAVELIRRIKVLAKLDTTTNFLPQEGGFSFVSLEKTIRLRVSIFPLIESEKVVIRLLTNDLLERISEQKTDEFLNLGMTKEQERCLKTFLGVNSGVILLSGPTGSGKSTLLYSALDYLNDEWRNVVTVEDPVERMLSGVNQVEISEKSELEFSDYLKPLLRQDPDVIMVGEMRDNKTAEMALTSGLTGHLVLSTVHAGSCIEVFTRLRQLGLSFELVALALRLVVSQRLVAKNCPHCVTNIYPTAPLAKFFSLSKDQPLINSVGCLNCNQTGIMGRLGVFELLPITEQFRTLLLTGKGVVQISDNLENFQEHLSSTGYRPYAHAVREALINGVISPNSALESLGISSTLMEL